METTADIATDDVDLGDDAAVEPLPPVPPRTEPHRSEWDRRARRFLRLPEDAPSCSLMGANNAASRSIAISATRCLVTYIFLPILGPLVGLSGAAGPILGLVLSAVSIVAIVYAARRFFAGDHRLRWPYFWAGTGIIVLLIAQAIIDLQALLA